MPYKSISELPPATNNLPSHAKKIWLAAFNSAAEQYNNEEKAFAVAMTAVKRKYIKRGDRWVSKDGDEVMRAFGDREFSAEERKKAAKSGAALPSGGFPIKSEKDLRNAIQAFGRAKNPAAAKAHIRERASALGLTKLLPENWDAANPGWELLKLDAAGGQRLIDAWVAIGDKQCPTCDGSGEDEDGDECPICSGTGYVNDARKQPDEDDGNGDGDGDGEDDNDNEGDDEDAVASKEKDAATVQLTDSCVMDGVRKTKDGYLVADARIARTGIQLYAGDEIGAPDMRVVRVYRPPSEVFSKASMKSMAHKPITLDHPPMMVDADNWAEYSVGHTGDEVSRDGDCVRVPMVIMDSKAIAAFEKHGVKELSVGYSTEIKWGKGRTPSGEVFDAKQTAIRGNHLAVVPAARGGSRLRIGDDDQKGDTQMVKVLIGDQTIEFVDELAAKHVQNHITRLHGAAADLQGKLDKSEADKEQEEEKKTRAETDAASKSGEIVALKKQLEDANAKLTGKAFDEAVKQRIELLTKANAVMEGKVSFDGKEPAEIKRMVVEAKLGDAAKGLSDEEISGAFKWASADVKPPRGTDRLADDLSLLSLGGGTRQDPKAIRDAAYAKYVERTTNAWKTNRDRAAG